MVSGYTLDPHTAVAWSVADQIHNKTEGVPLLIASTAHYAKFGDDVMRALTGSASDVTSPNLLRELNKMTVSPCMHQQLDRCLRDDVTNHDVLPADVTKVKDKILRMFL